jgi:hypothetical protein
MGMKEIENDLLKSAEARDGKIVADITRPFLNKYSDHRMRRVILALAGEGFLRLDRTSVKDRVFVKITPKGRRAIT